VAVQESEFASAFDWAVIRLATYFPASASRARLLFGSVSFLTKDRPCPTSSKAERHKVGKGKSGTVFFRRTVLSAHDAVAWYRSAGIDGITTPTPTEPNEAEEKKDGIPLLPTSFEDDPQWPSLGIPLGTDLFSNAGGPAILHRSAVRERRASTAALATTLASKLSSQTSRPSDS